MILEPNSFQSYLKPWAEQSRSLIGRRDTSRKYWREREWGVWKGIW